MIVAFRFLNEFGKANFAGFASAPTKKALFWQIDEFGDPYSCEIKKIPSCGMCVPVHHNPDGFVDVAPNAVDLELEIGERFGLAINGDDGWKKPDWSGV